MESWKDIKGFEGLYEVSSKGRVRSLDRIIPNSGRYSCDRKIKGKVLSPASGGYAGRYKIVNLKKCNTQKMKLVHRLVAEAFIPNSDPSKGQVNHKDGNGHNNVIENLEWMTGMENSRHYCSVFKRQLGYKTHVSKNGKITFHCRFRACGTDVSLGYYKTKQKCRKVFSDAYLEFYGVRPQLKELGLKGEA